MATHTLWIPAAPGLLVALCVACGPSDLTLDPSTDGDSGTEETGEPPPDMLSDDDKSELDALPGELQQIVDGTVAAFQNSEAPHECPHPNGSPSGGEAGYTTNMSVNCHLGPNNRCVPQAGGGGAGYYDSAEWSENPMWSAVGFAKTTPHSFHYNLTVENSLDGYGACEFAATALGDFDGDALFSTYELRGVVDESGVVLEALAIVDPYE